MARVPTSRGLMHRLLTFEALFVLDRDEISDSDQFFEALRTAAHLEVLRVELHLTD